MAYTYLFFSTIKVDREERYLKNQSGHSNASTSSLCAPHNLTLNSTNISIGRNVPRHQWEAWDPTLISEGIFAAANIFSSLKLVYIFTINPHLGPLQISLGKMVNDILKFSVMILLVAFAFACGLNQLFRYYAEMREEGCKEPSDDEICTKEIYKHFSK